MPYSYPVDGLYRAMKELSEKMKQMQPMADLKFLAEPSALEAIRNSFAAFGSLSLKVTTPEYFEAIQRAFSVPPIDPEIFTTSARTLKALAEASQLTLPIMKNFCLLCTPR